jgi:hypothetical protein
MKNLLMLILFISFYSCKSESKDYKYKIEGKLVIKNKKPYSYIPSYYDDKLSNKAIAYTDSIYGYNKDSIWYYNSNGYKTVLHKPYKVYKLK